MDTGKQMVKTGPTEISIYGHEMDVDRQISPYMGINGHTAKQMVKTDPMTTGIMGFALKGGHSFPIYIVPELARFGRPSF